MMPRRDPTPNWRHWPARALVLLLLGLGTSAGRSGEILMLMSGIAGESTAYDHAGWIDVSSLGHGMANLGGATVTNNAHNDVAFTKRVDSTSPILYDRLNRGTAIPEVKIDFIRHTPPLIQFFQINLTTVQVSSVQDSAIAGDGEMKQDVTLHYEQIAWTYTQVQTPGMPAATAAWSVATNGGSYSTNLLDSDLDGMPNEYELANGLDPDVSDGSADPDRDGLTNYQEFLCGTNPRNANSVLRVRRIHLANGQVRVTWSSVAGKTYTISAADQVNGPYAPVRNVSSAGNGETFTDFPPSAAHRFYRVATP